MPRNQFQRMIFALITVIITVHGFVFYSIYVVNGETLKQLTGEGSVLEAIYSQGGVYMFGRMLPIWAVILVEFCFAYALACLPQFPVCVLFAAVLYPALCPVCIQKDFCKGYCGQIADYDHIDKAPVHFRTGVFIQREKIPSDPVRHIGCGCSLNPLHDFLFVAKAVALL